MALGELSPNVRRGGTTERPAQTKKLDGISKNATDSFTPSAIQSMLKTSTEIGDIGQFSVRPSRLPRTGSRVHSTRLRSGSYDTSFASSLRHRSPPPPQHRSRRHYGPRPAESLSGLSRQDTIRSNPNSYHQNPRPRTRNYRNFPSGLEGLTGPPSGTHGLYSHRSLMTLRSQRDANSMHSNSPLAYPARIRPGYRASSPAFSDAHSYMRHLRNGNQRTGSGGTVASSPASMLMGRRGLPGYHPDLNGSFTSFIRLPSPAVPPSYSGVGRPYHPSRATTPLSASFRDPRAASTTSLASFPRLPKSPTGSTTPQYYDYTESFVEEDCFSPDGDHTQSSLPFNMDQTILENGPVPTFRHAQTPYGTMPGSSFHPSELPTRHNRRPSEHSKYSPPLEIPRRTSSLGAASILSTEHKVDPHKIQDDLNGSPEKNEEDNDPRRASITSRRTCASSHSSSFFPNASRSPRDLTSLAARVHSPLDEKNAQKKGSLTAFVRNTDGGDAAEHDSCDISMPALPTWQLPQLDFRPLSFVSYTNGRSGRPRTSDASNRVHTEIVSPTPERPMSSQSRKRFSKILEIGDDYSPEDERSVAITRSFNSLNFSRLKKLEEVPEIAYPARLSIPPFSPRTTSSRETDDGHELDIIDAYADTRSSQIIGQEKSTIDSLLDKHIESLGLQPESDDSTAASEGDVEVAETTKSPDATVKMPTVSFVASREQNKRLAPSRSCNYSSMTSGDRRNMMPRRLFASMGTTSARISVAESLPCLSSALSRETVRERHSLGWQTLASTSQFESRQSISKPSLLSGELADISSEDNIRRFKLKRRSGLSISPSSSSYLSDDAEERHQSVDAGRAHKQLRSDLDRNASHRRRMRIRLKIKRNSLSLGKLSSQSLKSPEQTPGPTHSTSEASEPVTDAIQTSAGLIAELSAEPIHRLPPISKQDSDPTADQNSAASPRIPHRWSSIVAGFPEPVKKSVDVVRKPSIATMRSHRSNTSLAEPINSTRLSSQVPRLGSVPCLAPQDFGPPLTTSDLNLSLPYAEMPSTIRPTLRETRSFFSDDSSGLQNGHGSYRKRFHMHSLRSVLPSSPIGTLQGLPEPSASVSRGKLPHSCQVIGRKSSEHAMPMDGTVGMSDFAYRRRKVLERVKDWWKRQSMQCVQKKLALRRRKNEKRVPGGVLT